MSRFFSKATGVARPNKVGAFYGGTAEFAVCCWVNAKEPAYPIANAWNAGGCFILAMNGNFIYGVFRKEPNNTVVTGTLTPFKYNTWMFFCMTSMQLGGGVQQCQVYVNGRLDAGVNPGSGNFNSNTTIALGIGGASNPGDQGFSTGLTVKDLHIYNRTLQSRDQLHLARHPGSLREGLVGYWPLTGNQKEFDLSVNACHATASGQTDGRINNPPITTSPFPYQDLGKDHLKMHGGSINHKQQGMLRRYFYPPQESVVAVEDDSFVFGGW